MLRPGVQRPGTRRQATSGVVLRGQRTDRGGDAQIDAAPRLGDCDLVEDLLPSRGVALLYGKWGTYKSFVALDLHLSVASGRAFHGHAVHRPGPSLYIVTESADGYPKRIRAW